MNTHDIELPPLPDTDWYAVWHGHALYGIYSSSTEAANAAAKLYGRVSVSAMYTEQQTQQAQHAAIEADRKRRGEPVAWKELALDAIRRMRAAHVNCRDFLAKAEGLLEAERHPQPAEPVKVPSDEDIDALARDFMSSDDGILLLDDHRGYARALLAKYGQPAQPAEGDERLNMILAAISTAAIGYWKEGDSIHPDYDTMTLHDVAKLYAKYAALHSASAEPVGEIRADDQPDGEPWAEVWADLPVGTKLFASPVAAQPIVPEPPSSD